jgi:hypothetical protein
MTVPPDAGPGQPESESPQPTAGEQDDLAWPELPDLGQFEQYGHDVFWRVVRYAVSLGYGYIWINEESPDDGFYLVQGHQEKIFIPLATLRQHGPQAARNLYLVLTTK